MRLRPDRAGQEPGPRDLHLGVRRPQVDQEPAGHGQAAGLPPGPPAPRRRAGPVEGDLGSDRPRPGARLDEAHAVPQEPRLRAPREAERPAQPEIPFQMSAPLAGGHGAPPGHGRATPARASTSSFA